MSRLIARPSFYLCGAGMANAEVCRFADAATLAHAAAERIVLASSEAIGARGRFLLVLSGGSTPEKTYSILARPENSLRIDWARTFLFFGDERMVSDDDPRGNYAMARRSLLTLVPVKTEQVFSIPTDRTPAECARAYLVALAAFFEQSALGPAPRFDLILLGLGDDGHTASLFPRANALLEKDWITWSPPGVLPPPVDRVTMTFPLLNAAREILFLVSGAGKAKPLCEVLECRPDPMAYPAAGVDPADGTLTWFVDEAAAALIAGATPASNGA